MGTKWFFFWPKVYNGVYICFNLIGPELDIKVLYIIQYQTVLIEECIILLTLNVLVKSSVKKV